MKKMFLRIFAAIMLASTLFTACKKSDSSSSVNPPASTISIGSVADGDTIVGTYTGTLSSWLDAIPPTITNLSNWQIQIIKTGTSNYEVLTNNATGLPNFNVLFVKNAPEANYYSIPGQTVNSQSLVSYGAINSCIYYYATTDSAYNLLIELDDLATNTIWQYNGTKQ